jgi:alkylation response protein AidB-like acyl-CoA dehydrogenase
MKRDIFTPDHDLFREQVRRFIQKEDALRAARWQAQGYVVREFFRDVGAQGYLLMWADARYGGARVGDFESGPFRVTGHGLSRAHRQSCLASAPMTMAELKYPTFKMLHAAVDIIVSRPILQ